MFQIEFMLPIWKNKSQTISGRYLFFAVVSGILSSCFASDAGHAYSLLDQISYLDQSVDKATLLVVNANNSGNQAFVPTTYTR